MWYSYDMPRGYRPSKYQVTDKIFGSENSIQGKPLNVGGHWLTYVPPQNVQQNTGIETEACTTFGTLDAIETLLRFKYKDNTVWSRRFLAYISGTTPSGNNPLVVVNTLAKKGDVPIEDWNINATMTTWKDVYAVPPQPLYTKALEFTAKYVIDHENVTPTPASLKAALEFSPLGVAGYAWQLDQSTGFYVTPPNAQPDHWFALVDYVDGDHWIVFDSYEGDIKKLAWDYVFYEAMRYDVSLNVMNTTTGWDYWHQFVAYMQKALSLGDYNPEKLGGKARSPEWPKVRAAHLKTQPVCQVCGGTKNLQVHHIQPFHLDQSLELDPNNLITLCENPKWNCHLKYGHFDNFRTKWNPEIKNEAPIWFKRYTAKNETEAV